MQDIMYAVSTLDQFSVVVAAFFVVIAFVLIREIVNSTALAVISAPVLMVGGLATNYLFHANFVMPVDDKDTNVVIASAVGVLTALVQMCIRDRLKGAKPCFPRHCRTFLCAHAPFRSPAAATNTPGNQH